MIRLSYWVAPIMAGVVWLATLLGLLLYWIVNEDRVHYVSMGDSQTVAYISDVGASDLKPLFIAGCVLTTVFLDLSFAADRWLRHKGRLAPYTATTERVLASLTIVFAVVGTAGLILLSIFDTMRHPKLHNVFLVLFIGGYVVSAIFICWEYQRLGMSYREHRVLRLSFYIKLAFVLIEIVLAIAFAACSFTKRYDPAAVLEWTIAFIFSAYVFSFYVDLYPAAATKPRAHAPAGQGGRREKERRARPGYAAAGEMEEGGSERTLTAGSGAPVAAGGAFGRGSRRSGLASNF
ncbi:hypothetical protein BT67DRAFT_18891 [Trichocladium antarcticum]|uniref:CWH43-like N-terminal domain-containing protein n=1 Tax=Trichocladium antarcticum TaxID=1450529 RepID=A0AAN6ZHK4_9PEZI|nr:hypothetical protein BT67DRAFT_18891 [Trichocladium antarcticum]